MMKNNGFGYHQGTCGEFIQGINESNTHFHVTCPIDRYSKIWVELSNSGNKLLVPEGHYKIELAVFLALKKLNKKFSNIVVKKRSDLFLGKGMGSSTADILATIKAVYDACGKKPTLEDLINIAVSIESSDGVMVPGVAAFCQKTGEILQRFKSFPQYNIIVIIPNEEVITSEATCSNQVGYLLEKMLSCQDDPRELARCATASSLLTRNRYARRVMADQDSFDILGVCVGHTGAVCGVLFAPGDSGRKKSDKYLKYLIKKFPTVSFQQTLLLNKPSI